MRSLLPPLTTLAAQVADILALHSDTKHVISSASDATVRVWVPAQQRCIHVIEPFRLPATALHVRDVSFPQ